MCSSDLDEDKESHPQCLHNPTHAQGEGGGCVCYRRRTSGVFYSSITKIQIKMIKLDPCEAQDPI